MATVPHVTTDATLITLAAALRLQLAGDAAGQRAVDRAVEHLSTNPVYEFDGVELRITSFSRRGAVEPVEHVTDGELCTCEGRRHPWCLHRVEFRLLLAQMSMREPAYLRAKILEQCQPEYVEPAYA